MTKTCLVAGSLLAVVLGAPPATAAQQMQMTMPPPPPPAAPLVPGEPVTIDQLVAQAVAHAPAVKAAWARVDIAKGDAQMAHARAVPELMTEHRDAFDGMNRQTSVGLTVPLELGRRGPRTSVATLNTAQSALAAYETARQTAAAVRLAAVRALAAERLVAIGMENVGTHQAVCDFLSVRVQAGATAQVELDMHEVELMRAQAEVTRMRAEAVARWNELKVAAGVEANIGLRLVESLEDAVARLRAVTPALAWADLDSRYDVAEAQAAVEVADAKAAVARSEGKWDVNLTATYMRMAAGFDLLGMSEAGNLPIQSSMHQFAIGATVMLPGKGKSAGAVAAAEGEKRAAEFERDGRLLAARAEVAAAENRDKEAGTALALYSGGLLTQAQRVRDVIKESFLLGRATRLEVLEAERQYRDVRLAHVAALVEAFEARVLWMQALGGTR